MLREPIGVIDGEGRSSPFREGAHRLGDFEVVIARREEAGGTRLNWCVRNVTSRAAQFTRFGLEVATPPSRVLEHGWQSWSVVRRCQRDDTRPQRRGAPRWRRTMLMADPASAGDTVCGDQFLLDEGGITGFPSAVSHFATVAASSDRVTAWALLDGVTLEGNPGAGPRSAVDRLWRRRSYLQPLRRPLGPARPGPDLCAVRHRMVLVVPAPQLSYRGRRAPGRVPLPGARRADRPGGRRLPAGDRRLE
jgi:hypothetical protein